VRVLEWTWGGIEGAILQPPVSWPEAEMSTGSGVIRDITREQLDDSCRSSMDELEQFKFTHSVGVHSVGTFVVWEVSQQLGSAATKDPS
jgi:hypothetical protein